MASDERPVFEDDEITIERRRTPRVPAPGPHAKMTKRMQAIDARLLAILRGEVEPDAPEASDPFGGLIPVYDDEVDVASVPEEWLELEDLVFEPPVDRMRSVPRPRLRAEQVVELPIDHRQGFLLSQMDGIRTIEELVDVCQLPPAEALEMIDELIVLGAIDILPSR